MSNKTIDEILGDITFHPSDIDMDNERREYATQAITQAMLDIVGEDETLDMGGSFEAVQRHNKSYDRNQLRTEIRTAIKKIGGE